MNNKPLIALALILIANISKAESLLDKALGIVMPAKEFAGVSLNSSIKDIKQLGFKCEDGGTDAINGKVVSFTGCEDNKYKSEIFGLDVKGRSVVFVDGKLAIIKILKRDMFVNEDSYEVLRKKLDTVYPKAKTPPNADPKDGYWDYGGNATLISGSPLKIQTDITDFSKFVWSLGILVTTPAADALRKK